MSYTLTSLIDIPKVEEAMQIFYEITGIPPSITDTDGQVLMGIGWQPVCTEFHRKHPETYKRCLKSDTQLAAQLSADKFFASYKCLNGLIDMAVPITVEGKHLANLFAGQFFFEPPDMDYFKRQAAQFGFDEDAYLEAVKKVPIFTQEKMEKGMLFLSKIAALLGEMGLAEKKLAVLNEELKLQIREQTDQLRQEMKERKRAEAERLEASKFEGVLEMAGAAAHEFSQPLQVLRSDAEFLADNIDSDDPDVMDALVMINENVIRLGELVGKVQRITRYKAIDYSTDNKIVDIDRASGAHDEGQGKNEEKVEG